MPAEVEYLGCLGMALKILLLLSFGDSFLPYCSISEIVYYYICYQQMVSVL